jgi:hypothetical protein
MTSSSRATARLTTASAAGGEWRGAPPASGKGRSKPQRGDWSRIWFSKFAQFHQIADARS